MPRVMLKGKVTPRERSSTKPGLDSGMAWRMAAGATMAVTHTEPPYQDAVVAARRELAALRKASTPPSAQSCSAEELLITQPIFR